MERVQENKMGRTPILKLIFSMSVPAMFSMLIQSLYNVVDSIFVAQIGEEALTAVSLAFPIQMLLIAVGVGTGVGVNSLVSRRLGEKRQEEASHAATHGILLAVLSWILFALFGLFFTDLFFANFTQNPTVAQMGIDYTKIVTIFSFGSLIQISIEKTLQATGNMIYPMIFQLIGAVTNIILDPIMIFGWFGFPAMGVAGAAVATVAGQILAMFFSIYIAFAKSHQVHISFKNFKLRMRIVKDIYAVGFPSIIMQSIGSILVVGLNKILIGFSDAAVAVLGVYYKLQSFVFMPVFGLTQGIMPILGYNYGAKNKKRMMSALRYGCIIAACIMLAGMIIFLVFPRWLLMLFNASQAMLDAGIPALRLICICFVPAAFGILFSTLFQAVGMGGKSLLISVLRQLVVILPCAYLFSRFGLNFTWLAFPTAEMVSLLASVIMFYFLYQKHLKYLGDGREFPSMFEVSGNL